MHITIIGGGVVGLTLANLLASIEDFQITLLDHTNPPSSGLKMPYDLRVTAVNIASEAIFRSTNIPPLQKEVPNVNEAGDLKEGSSINETGDLKTAWDLMTHLRISPYEKMLVWDEKSPATIQFDAADVGQNHLGHIIEYSVLKQALYQTLISHKNAHLVYGAQPIALQEIQDSIVLSLADGTLLHTHLLIGSDGGNSWVAQQAGLSSTPKPYHHSALVTTLKTEKPHHKIARQRFLTTGPLAFLPLEDPHLVSIVWSTPPEQANHLATLSDAAFNEAVANAIEYQLGTVEAQDQRIVFPLAQRHAKHYTKSRIALIGDAAHTLHPLAGQGMNLGLQDAACLAHTLKAAHRQKKDVGAFSVLREYERARKGENALMIEAMRGFKYLFGSDAEWLTHTRALGFALADNVPFVKHFFMERAMGV